MKRYIKIIIVAVIVLCATGGYIYYKKHHIKKTETHYLTETVTRGDIVQEIQGDGTLAAKKTFEVNSSADGRIKAFYVKEGDKVKKGQKIVTVMPGKSAYDKFLPVEVTAPSDGLVLRCLNERSSSRSKITYTLPQIGEFINGSGNYNATCIVKIVQADRYVLPFKLNEYDISKIYPGMPVVFSVMSKPGLRINGKISYISPQPEIKEEDRWNPESNKVVFVVVAETEEYKGPLLIGLSASVKIEIEKKKDVLRIPSSAIFEENGREGLKFFVYRRTGEKQAVKTEIKPGLRNDNNAELLNAEETGIKEKDELFLDVKGDKIEVKEQSENGKDRK